MGTTPSRATTPLRAENLTILTLRASQLRLLVLNRSTLAVSILPAIDRTATTVDFLVLVKLLLTLNVAPTTWW
jgi:hypothetical protein